jgi:glycosyltransferase involved in cell wall biosynthesis
VAIAHDYLAVLGGAERVVRSILSAFPGAPVYTSIYNPDVVFPGFADQVTVHPMRVNDVQALRSHYRRALPVLARSFSNTVVDADVVLCSSSGWAHGIGATGRKLVYCHNPARWLYQRDDYLRGGRRTWYLASRAMEHHLKSWDQRAAQSCDAYLANSSVVARRVKEIYGIEAEVVPPPAGLSPDGPREPVPGVESGSFLCVGRLQAYKHVSAIITAFGKLNGEQLVIVGDGPERRQLERMATPNVRFVGKVSDAQLRWLYGTSRALVAASHEDFGLTPIEAARFGKPSALLAYGGFLDSAIEGVNAVLFEHPSPIFIRHAVLDLLTTRWDEGKIKHTAERYGQPEFAQRLHDAVDRVVGG